MLTEIEQSSIYISANYCQVVNWLCLFPKINFEKLGKESALNNSVTTTDNQIIQKENFQVTEGFLELPYAGVLGCGAMQPEAKGGQNGSQRKGQEKPLVYLRRLVCGMSCK